MDPFSVTCGVAGLLSLADVVAEKGYNYISTVKDARQDIADLIEKVAALSHVLSRLVPVVDRLGISGYDAGMITKHSQISDCEGILLKLQNILQTVILTPSSTDTFTTGSTKKNKLGRVMGSISNAAKIAKWPLKKDETEVLMNRLEKHKSTFIMTLTADSLTKIMDVFDQVNNTACQVESVRNEQDRVAEAKRESDRIEKLCWLFPDDPNHKHEDIRQKRHENTGEWFFQTDEFKDWYREPSWLFCHGKPGAGKTVLLSTVVDYIKRNSAATSADIGIAHIYFSFKESDSQTVAKVFSSILRQLGFQKEELPAEIEHLHAKFARKGETPGLIDLFDATISLLRSFSSVWLFFDALDEYDEQTRPNLLSHLGKLMQTNSRGFVTSRPHNSTIQSTFAMAKGMELSAHDDDIKRVLRSKLSFRRKQLKPELVDEIITRVLKNADGVFLIATFQVQFIARNRRESDVRSCLEQLPTGLDDTYKRIIANIKHQTDSDKRLALSAISWISHASRPLKTKEFCLALSIAEGDTAIDDDDVYDKEDLIEICGGLVKIDESSQTVRFVHHTVQEFLQESPEIPTGPVVHAQIAKICVTYLSFVEFDKCFPRPLTRSLLRKELEKSPFHEYAAENWGYHAKFSDEDDVVIEMLCTFSLTGNPVELAINADRSQSYPRCLLFTKPLNILSTAAMFGLSRLTAALIQQGSLSCGVKNYNNRTPLSLAAERGHLEIVEHLVGRDEVQADSKNKDGGTPLSSAAESGHLAVVKLLVGRDDVQADSKNNYGRTPLCLAALSGHLGVVEFLVGRDDVQTGSKDNYGQTPLSLAAWNGHLAVVEFLVGRDDVQADSKDEGNRTPLSFAAESGHLAVVELLVGRDDVKADSKDNSGQTPLSMAKKNGYLLIVQLLLPERRERRP